jgi:hypothetical protein
MAICNIIHDPGRTPQQHERITAHMRRSGPAPPQGCRLVLRHRRKLLALTLAAAAIALAPASANAASPVVQPVSADWTSVSANTATGSLLGTDVSLSGSHVWDTPSSVIDGSWPNFSGPDFSPALSKSDAIQISGAPGFNYTLRFSSPTTDPILEIGSLASRIEFPVGTEVTRLSGQTAFKVKESAVTGAVDSRLGPDGLNDASGTVELRGTYTSISFSARALYRGPEDGIMVQLVARPQFTDWTSADGGTAGGMLAGASVSLSGSRVSSTPSSVIDGSWPYFNGPDFSPALAQSDAIQLFGGLGYSYTIRFGAPTTDPILHLGSLASRIDFPAGTPVIKLSGQTEFTVSGNSVFGNPTNTLGPDGLSDASGTIRLRGTYTSITFTATPLYTGPDDGIMLQLGS